MRFFTTEGPVKAEDHYYLPPLQRWDLAEILTLIDQKKYFLLHAPRQTGKTTCLLALTDYLNQNGRYRALYVNIEAAQAARERVEAGMVAIVQSIANSARWQLRAYTIIKLLNIIKIFYSPRSVFSLFRVINTNENISSN